MEALKKYKHLYLFHFGLNVLVMIFITNTSYYHLPLLSFKDHITYGMHLLAMQFCQFGFMYVLSLNKWVFNILFPILFFIFSSIGFWGYTHEIYLSSGVVQATLESKPDIIFDLFTWQLLIYQLIVILVIIGVLYYYNRLPKPKNSRILLSTALLAIAFFFTAEYVRKGTFIARLPFNFFYIINNYFKTSEAIYYSPVENTNYNNKNLKVIFVLGESVRADHLSLNGYPRNTTPLLSQRNNLISFKNAYTPFTFTSASVPNILSDHSVYQTEEKPQISLILALKAAKISSIWLGNQTPEKSFYPFIQHSDHQIFADPIHADISMRKEMDNKLLPLLDEYLEHSEYSFILMHMIGSHWFYESRYPEEFRQFTPTIRSKYVPENDSIEMVNSYDNTILYLDYILNAIISKVENKNEEYLIVYVSDHGEQMGEDGKWLHAQPTNRFSSVSNPAVMLWYSDLFLKNHPSKVAALHYASQRDTLALDFVFHSFIDAYGIENIPYDTVWSIFHLPSYHVDTMEK